MGGDLCIWPHFQELYKTLWKVDVDVVCTEPTPMHFQYTMECVSRLHE
jgi:hypothetical protein